MTLSLPHISINASVSELAQCIESSDGLLVLDDLPAAPFDAILNLLQQSPDVTSRLNQAAHVPVYNDADSDYKPGSRLRSLDLSPSRLEAMAQVDPEVIQAPALTGPMQYYETFQNAVHSKLLPALAKAIGMEAQDLRQDVVYNYRMLDYYPTLHEQRATAPRLAEHRDFGFFTLIQATHPGLEVKRGKKWQTLPPIPKGSACVVFGWCAHVRSNGRIPASLHRVTKHMSRTTSRVAAVLFGMPASGQTSLERIVLHQGETPRFRSGIIADDLQQRITTSQSQQHVEEWLAVPKAAAAATSTHKKSPVWNRIFGRSKATAIA